MGVLLCNDGGGSCVMDGDSLGEGVLCIHGGGGSCVMMKGGVL